MLVDLFSGCGGFTLGARSAGFKVGIAVDIDPILASSFGFNFPDTLHIQADVSKLSGKELRTAFGGTVTGVFGGPPCQGFSSMGTRSISDPRRTLVHHFFRVVSESEPRFFVMENVRGLAFADSVGLLTAGIALLRDKYHVFGPVTLDAAAFGAATSRPRLFVIGMHREYSDPIDTRDIERVRRAPSTVKAAIADLEGATFVGERDGLDWWRISRAGRPSSYASLLRSPDGLFTGHRSTTHSNAVIQRFRRLKAGDVDPVGRHAKLDWRGLCPTLRAGTGADRGSFQSVRPIHPLEPRVITVREAARLQGFPDSHIFHPTIWHSFRMIGNSVSPIIAEALFSAIREKITEA